MPDLLLCVSAFSGGGNAVKIAPKVARILSQRGWKVHILYTKDKSLCDIAANTEYDYIAALGGDGYISSIAYGVWKTGKTLMPLPAGRGNDFCRKLGIGANSVKYLENKEFFVSENIDVALSKDNMGDEKIILGILSLGIDSVSNHYANMNSFLSGMLVYLWGFYKAVREFKPLTYKITVDGQYFEATSWTLGICSSGIYGGGIKLIPFSDLKDGLLDVITTDNISFFSFLKLICKIPSGKHIYSSNVQILQCTEITIDCDSKFLPYADGDLAGKLPITVKVLPSDLKIIY